MMDVATSLVQAYLHVNGYFTATDYPLVESARDNAPRMLTDIDMLAVRFGRPANSHARRGKPTGKVKGPVVARTDPALECPGERTDMIVAEVKQGRAQVNPGSRNRHALAAAIARYILRIADLHDPALGWLSLLHKCELTLQPERPVR